MEAQIRQNKIFQAQKGSIDVRLTLTHDENPVLLIQVTDTEQFTRYNLRVDQQYLQNQETLFTVVPNAEILYDQMKEGFDNLNITAEGTILMELQVGTRRVQSKKTFRLQGEREEMDPVRLFSIQVEQLRREMRADSLKKAEQIEQLKKDSAKKGEQIAELQIRLEGNNKEQSDIICDSLTRKMEELEMKQMQTHERSGLHQTEIEEIRQQIESLRAEVKEKIEAVIQKNNTDTASAQRDIGRVREELQQAQNQIEEFKLQTLRKFEEIQTHTNTEMREIREESERYAEALAAASQSTHQLTEQLAVIRRTTEEVEERKAKMAFLLPHPENPHKNCFSITESYNAITINKLTSNVKWDNHIGSVPLTVGQTHSFTMKNLKITNNYAYLGICSKNAFGSTSAYCHNEAISLRFIEGNLYEFGSSRASGGGAVGAGGVVTMRVDLAEWRLEWLVGGKYVAASNIATHLRSQKIYLFAAIVYAGSGEQCQLFCDM